MSVSEPNLTASEASAVSLLETFAAVARRRTSATSTVSSTNTKNQSTSNTTSSGTYMLNIIFSKNNMFFVYIDSMENENFNFSSIYVVPY